MKSNKNLRNQEKILLTWLEEQNIVREIVHGNAGHPRYGILKSTTCRLYDGNEYKKMKNTRTKDGKYTIIAHPIILAISCCSNLDTFNKTLGRLIATGRAIKKLKNKEMKED